MKEYLETFFENFDYPVEARELLGGAYQRICADPRLSKEFHGLLESYEKDMHSNFSEKINLMTALSISFDAGVHEYTGYLLLIICMSKTLKRYYQEHGLSEEIWETSMYDIKWKMLECKDVNNIYGTFVAEWFAWFFDLQRFGFGKMQFEVIPFGRNYTRDGVTLTPDSKVLHVHMPRTGGRLDPESVRFAYKQAIDFFKKWNPEALPVFVCNSWLLFPRNKEILSPQSNLYKFISDYDIIECTENTNYGFFWRLFDMRFRGNVDDLPQNTSLRRSYADWARKGMTVGWALGVYIYKEA